MPYAHTTRLQAENLLAALLADASKVRWIADELQTYILEALRTFGGLTGMWEMQSNAIALAAGAIFVDIPTSVPERAYTVTDRDLIGALQYHLIEPKSVSAWTGSERFVLDDLTKVLQRRRDQFLLETGCRLTRSVLPPSPSVIGPDATTYELPDTMLDLERVMWTTADGKVTRLGADSVFGFRAGSPNWNIEPGLPRAYMLSERAPLLIEFGPPPLNDGRIDVLAVETGAALDPTVGVLLGVPDDFAWVIKWGALADLLGRDGPARDYARSLFCERRYRLGVAAALANRPVSEARINGRVMQIDQIDQVDMARPYWQSKTGTPICVALAGMNLVAIEQPPATASQLQLTLWRNVPLPAADGDFLQIGREYLNVVLGYAVHLAMFKIGGQELAATTHLAEGFFLAAADFNDRLHSFSAFEDNAFAQNDKRVKQRDRGVRRVTGSTVSEAT